MAKIDFDHGYANKQTAQRAMRNGDLNTGVVERDGKWYVLPPEQAPARPRRRIAKPVAYVRKFVADHPNMPRREVIATLVRRGVNRSTASVQYHKLQRA